MKLLNGKNNLFFSSLVTLAFLSGCSKPPAAPMMNPESKQKLVSKAADRKESPIANVELVFVVDNSGSMKNHIANLVANVGEFVQEFSRNTPFEYHLAVMSVYDSRTFSSQKYKSKFGGTDKVFSKGEFRQVQSAPGVFVPNKYFISSRDENLVELLKNTLNVGVQGTDIGGPSIEESFIPVAAAYGFSGHSASPEVQNRQKDFFFGKDSYKIIFFLTDARDASDISAGEFYQQMVRLSGGDSRKVMTFGAIVPADNKSCKRDPGALPNVLYSIEEVLDLSKKENQPNNMMVICDDFGKKMAAFGQSIRQLTVGQIISLGTDIPIMATPSHDGPNVCSSEEDPSKKIYDHLHVCFGEQEIPMETLGGTVGYLHAPYDNNNPKGSNYIRINPNFKFDMNQRVRDPKIRLIFNAADPKYSIYR